MTQHATIFIPDISGYTEFATRVELDHSSHILAELLEVLVGVESLGLTLSEVEGDAVLYYAPGTPIGIEALLDQCEAMYRAFHRQLKIIERDSICPCGACQAATGLEIKFVTHFGLIKEIAVATFRKAAGVDMIVAHRLLKNGVSHNEYLLLSEAYLDAAGAADRLPRYRWRSAKEPFAGVGELGYAYASLEHLRAGVPDVEPRPARVIVSGASQLEVEIAAPVPVVYQAIIDVDNASSWMVGMEGLERDPVTERVGMRHVCVYPDATLEITYEHGECTPERAILANSIKIREMEVDCSDLFELDRTETGGTRVRYRLAVDESNGGPSGVVDAFLPTIRESLERLKENCEAA